MHLLVFLEKSCKILCIQYFGPVTRIPLANFGFAGPEKLSRNLLSTWCKGKICDFAVFGAYLDEFLMFFIKLLAARSYGVSRQSLQLPDLGFQNMY